MIKLLASIQKELLLLWRDRAGMLVLFLMPAALVLIITLVQENIFKLMGETEMSVLFVDNDKQELGTQINAEIQKLGKIKLVTEIEGKDLNEESVVDVIKNGAYQFGIIIPAGITESIRAKANRDIDLSLGASEEGKGPAVQVPDVVVYFDPIVRPGFRSAVMNMTSRVVIGMEVEEKMKLFSDKIPGHLEKVISETLGPIFARQVSANMPEVDLSWVKEQSVVVREEFAFQSAYARLPNSVQQNVPAWALFGMFFIVVPMAGALIFERREGTLARLMTMPVSYLSLLTGKVAAYLCVNFAQFFLIYLMGKYLLPVLGTPSLDMGSDPLAVLIVVLCASLAATGYGIMLGAVSRTFEQASMFGAISVVIAAAIGGVMVPVYAMPEFMQTMSVVSPLGWGLDAFLDLFVRGGGFREIVPEALLLLAFFCVSMATAWYFLFKKIRSGL